MSNTTGCINDASVFDMYPTRVHPSNWHVRAYEVLTRVTKKVYKSRHNKKGKLSCICIRILKNQPSSASQKFLIHLEDPIIVLLVDTKERV